MSDETKHDDKLYSILEECKNLPELLDIVFGFLQRRTDFFEIKTNPQSPVGLPPGYAEMLVKKTFDKFKDKSPVVETTVVDKSQEQVTKKKSSHSNNIFDPSKSYNGAAYENYCWSQRYNEVDLFLKLPQNVKSRDLVINSTAKTISVKLKDGTELLSGDLSRACKSDIIWSVESNELQIHFEKVQEVWWDCFLTTEQKLDVSKIDCSKPMEDLPEDVQAKIEKLRWDQEQKRLGLPTSDEINKIETLKKAWDAEGSPFSGPFDPSSVSFN